MKLNLNLKHKTWADIGFEIEPTLDGSLSLRQLESVDPEKYRGESMHHSGGAWAETLLIYGTPIKEVFQKIARPHFMIVGLGLGYIELTIAREALLQGKSAEDVGLITSYESIAELREFFFAWLHDEEEKIHPEVWNTYQQVATLMLQETGLTIEQIKIFLTKHIKAVEDLQGALTPATCFHSRYHMILYDAFSAKTTPFLWEEEFLKRVFQASADFCLVSTYASRVSLKNALGASGFEVITRRGFKGKRNSTLGIKV